jgi:hypothetical protein
MRIKTILLMTAIAFLSIFLIGGCVQTDQNDEATEPEITVAEPTIKDCRFSMDCEDGFHCMNRECISNDLLKNHNDCDNNVCTEPCSDCERGMFTCMYSTNSFSNNKCVECFMRSHCNPGYECKRYQCVLAQK